MEAEKEPNVVWIDEGPQILLTNNMKNENKDSLASRNSLCSKVSS